MSADRTPTSRGITQLTDIRDGEGRDGGPELVIRGEHPVIAMPVKLGWRRNLLVSGMQTGRTRTVGVVIPPYDSFWIGVLAGIHERLGEADYLPITVWLGDLDHMPHFEADETRGIRLMNRLLDRRVDGLILWPPFGLAYYQHARELQDRTVPVVMIDYHSDAAICDAVTTDEAAATAVVARHLRDLGHRDVAYISSREVASQSWAVERRRGLEAACAAVGVRLGSRSSTRPATTRSRSPGRCSGKLRGPPRSSRRPTTRPGTSTARRPRPACRFPATCRWWDSPISISRRA